MASFTINGEQVNVDANPNTPLLWVVREHLQLTGTKFGCGVGQCGACTVHVDGGATYACLTPVSAVEGREVTTIEGLSASGDHPLQQALCPGSRGGCLFIRNYWIRAAAGHQASQRGGDRQVDVRMVPRALNNARI